MSSPSSALTLRIFDGSRQLFSGAAKFLITIIDGNQKQLVRDYFPLNVINFSLPFYDNGGDNYSVIAWADGHRQSGYFPVTLSNKHSTTLDLMLVADNPGFNFAAASWDSAFAHYPFLGGDTDEATAKARYEALLETERPLACLLNLCEAMSQIHLAQDTPLQYIKQIRWDEPPAQDRFFAYCDPLLVDQVRAAAAKHFFSMEPAPGLLHPGATNSWKQNQFGEADVQLTFHENASDQLKIGDIRCVTLEPDMDYYKDLAAHIFLEVLVNGLTHSLTDPVDVYILRWIAGRQAGVPEFAPLYTLTP
jgi:hypothetical protein